MCGSSTCVPQCRVLLPPEWLVSTATERSAQLTKMEITERFRLIEEQLAAIEQSARVVEGEMGGSRKVQHSSEYPPSSTQLNISSTAPKIIVTGLLVQYLSVWGKYI